LTRKGGGKLRKNRPCGRPGGSHTKAKPKKKSKRHNCTKRKGHYRQPSKKLPARKMAWTAKKRELGKNEDMGLTSKQKLGGGEHKGFGPTKPGGAREGPQTWFQLDPLQARVLQQQHTLNHVGSSRGKNDTAVGKNKWVGQVKEERGLHTEQKKNGEPHGVQGGCQTKGRLVKEEAWEGKDPSKKHLGSQQPYDTINQEPTKQRRGILTGGERGKSKKN